MKTIVSLSGGYGSAYNLWQLAQSTSDEITAIFVDFEYFPIGPRIHIKSYKSIDKSFAQNVCDWVNANVRPITFLVLDISNYQPDYSGIPQLEIVNYAKNENFNKIIFSDDIKDDSTPSVILRRAISRANSTNIQIVYPIRDNNSTNYQSSKLLPESLRSVCYPNSIQEKSLLLEQNGLTESEIVNKQINYTTVAFLENRYEWVHYTEEFGLNTFERNFTLYYPQYIKLWKD